MNRHPIFLSESSASSTATLTRFSPLDHLSIMVIRLPDEQFSLYLIQDAQPIRFLWHVQRVEKRLCFHRCSVEIVGDYRSFSPKVRSGEFAARNSMSGGRRAGCYSDLFVGEKQA
jgi:hypothetical protein